MQAMTRVSPMRHPTAAIGGMAFPPDAIARIYRPARSPSTAGRAETRKWRLEFERRSAPFVEPLTGWTGGDDPLASLSLSFGTRESAVDFARRAGLRCVVIDEQQPVAAPTAARDVAAPRPVAASLEDRAANDVIATYLSYAMMQTRYGAADPPPRDVERALLDPDDVYRSPHDVLDDAAVPPALKREILQRWAWDEFLAETASDEAMPEGKSPSRLDEVKRALIALDERERGAYWLVTAGPGRQAR
jgi:hypothetical protein